MEEERKLGAPEEKAASPAADGAQGIPLPAGTDRPKAPAACDAPEAMPAASETQPEAGTAQAEAPASGGMPQTPPANGPAASCGTPPPPPGPYPFQAGQPHPWQQPGFGPGAFGYGALPPRPKRPRRRLTLGVRVFLSVLAVIAIFSLGGVCASAIDRSMGRRRGGSVPL